MTPHTWQSNEREKQQPLKPLLLAKPQSEKRQPARPLLARRRARKPPARRLLARKPADVKRPPDARKPRARRPLARRPRAKKPLVRKPALVKRPLAKQRPAVKLLARQLLERRPVAKPHVGRRQQPSSPGVFYISESRFRDSLFFSNGSDNGFEKVEDDQDQRAERACRYECRVQTYERAE